MTTSIDGGGELEGDRTLLGRAVLNLLLNAGQAASGGTVQLRCTSGDGRVRIEVHDDGPGVPEEMRSRIFQPFFTTKGKGSGLGLLPVRTAAESFHGTLELERSDLGGACFRLDLPRATRP